MKHRGKINEIELDAHGHFILLRIDLM